MTLPFSKQSSLIAFMTAALAVVGCSGGSEPAVASSALVSDSLDQVGLSDVSNAASSCEGLLDGVTDFAVLGETGLLVGLDAVGDPVCIDTVEAIETELDEEGRDSSSLDYRYEATMSSRGRTSTPLTRRDLVSGDPNPEPNEPYYRAARAVASTPGI